MSKWTVSIPVGATAEFVVDAESEEEAIDKVVTEHGEPTLCWRCEDVLNVGGFDLTSATAVELQD